MVELGKRAGVSFQQINKYESGENRISAGRIYLMASALQVPVEYFYDGLEGLENSLVGESVEVMGRKETLDLVRAYYQLGERPRRRLLDLAKSLHGDNPK